MLFLVVPTASGKDVLFTKFKYVYPECEKLIRGQDQLYPLICLRGPCHMNNACMETLAIRINLIFDTFTAAEVLILYFKYQDTKSLRAGVFFLFLREPRLITINPFSWQTCKDKGEVFEWDLPPEVFIS